MAAIYEFTQSMKASRFVRGASEYQRVNRLVDDTGARPAESLVAGLYVYLYDNSASAAPIHDRNITKSRPNGKIVCPPAHWTVKSGKFKHGLHLKVEENHRHLWRPNLSPPMSDIWPQVLQWFLVFETEPEADEQGVRRETLVNRAVRSWLNTQGLAVARQPYMEHRWITRSVTVAEARGFLNGLLRRYPHW
jgi:hypothetical protein